MKKIQLLFLISLTILLTVACTPSAETLEGSTNEVAASVTDNTSEIDINTDLDPDAMTEALLEAIRQDDLAKVKAYIDTGIDINNTTTHGASPIGVAIYKGNLPIIQTLLDAGAEHDIQIFYTLIMQAEDQPEIVQLILSTGMDINAAQPSIPEHSLLMFAAEAGSVELGREMLAQGADINQVDLFNDPALNVAAFHGQLEFVKMLVEMGAELTVRGYGDSTATSHAEQRGHDDVVEYLLSVGAEK